MPKNWRENQGCIKLTGPPRSAASAVAARRVHLVSTTGLSGPKSETRIPKSEGSPKPEIRTRSCVGGLLPCQSERCFGLRISDLGDWRRVVLTSCAPARPPYQNCSGWIALRRVEWEPELSPWLTQAQQVAVATGIHPPVYADPELPLSRRQPHAGILVPLQSSLGSQEVEPPAPYPARLSLGPVAGTSVVPP